MITTLLAMVALSPVHRTQELLSISDLPARFNAARGEARLVLVLSPTLPSCLSGARIVRRDVVDELVGEPVKTFVVWTPMMGDDSRDAAEHAADLLDTLDVDQFWDPNRSLAREYGKLVQLPNNRVLAWNVYMLHSRADVWRGGPPKPVAWMHQLGRDQRTLDGSTLLDLVTKEVKKPLRPARVHRKA